PELHRLLLVGGEDVQPESLDRRAAVLGVEPAEALDPHPRPVRNQLRVDGDDARLRVRLGERRRDPVVEASVGRAHRRVFGHGEAPSPRARPDGRCLLGRREDLLVAVGERRERAARAGRGAAAFLQPVLDVVEPPGRGIEAPGGEQDHAHRDAEAPGEPAGPYAQAAIVLVERGEGPRIDDHGASPVCVHGGPPVREACRERRLSGEGRPAWSSPQVRPHPPPGRTPRRPTRPLRHVRARRNDGHERAPRASRPCAGSGASSANPAASAGRSRGLLAGARAGRPVAPASVAPASPARRSGAAPSVTPAGPFLTGSDAGAMVASLTQLQAACAGGITPEMRRVAQRECVSAEFIREEVARGRLVIPANVRHLAGSGGGAPLPTNGHDRSYPDVPVGHAGASADARLWVNQSVAQRAAAIAANALRGDRAPRRLDPTGIGRMITTKINANIGASPVASGLAAEVEKLEWAQRYGADTLMDLSTGGDLAACRQAIIDSSTIPIGTVPIYSMIVGRRIEDLTYDVILREIERQARQGVDYFTIHAG